jgi:hypothetical protein
LKFGKYQVKPGKPFCLEVKPGKKLRTVQRMDPLTSEMVYVVEEVSCPKGKFNSGGSGECTDCPSGFVNAEEGSATCVECAIDRYIKQVGAVDGQGFQPDNQTCVNCPKMGVTCDGKTKRYTGGVWHDPAVANPDKTTRMYVCVTEGCPRAGDEIMECKSGFKADSPLCAICEVGYFKQIRNCSLCGEPRYGALIACLILGALFVFALLKLMDRVGGLQKLRKMSPSAVAHIKIVISFIVVATTVHTQFGVVWPASFVRFLVSRLDLLTACSVFSY